ncbi:XdhC/CoxI family protein [Selenihalanaerobacter shriftii]|uniref:Xanthine dehydrogenase accessory factor n=1 Tax=Selenihalanaerobacter shriftii TaxID=142842 RepID=A0A1T4JTN9_9FIRM|nr:XdhC/CoxI family protein [Selenihalanaerobacter shriftii]SJZ33518.1 xanthine dehydrogenase accessory factor [Selenihalanaerobacter shriftii]
MTVNIFKELLTSVEAKERVALSTITKASDSKLVGNKLLVKDNGNYLTNLPTDALSNDELDKLTDYTSSSLESGQIENLDLELEESKGSIEFVVEPYLPNPRLILFGGGHVGQSLYEFAKKLDFKLIVVDDRPSFANQKLFPEVKRVICTAFENVSAEIEINEADYIVIATRGHQHDYTCLKQVIKSKAKYIGMLGSKRRVYSIFNRLKEEDYSGNEIDQINAPIGLDIGSETPEEIGISILAEIIKIRRTGDQSNTLIGEEAIELLADYQGGHDTLALATIIDTSGSTPRKAGSKMVVLPDGRTVGTIGGGCGEAEVRQKALDIINGQLDSLVHTNKLSNDVAAEEGMVCGGRMEVFIEAIQV